MARGWTTHVTNRGRTALRRAATAALVVAALLPVTAVAHAGAPALATDPGTQRRQVIDSVNAERAARGLPRLAEFADVSVVSQRWAEHEAATGEYRHNPAFAAQLAGYSGMGEAIHLSYRTDSDGAWAVRGWMDSPPHRAILLGDFSALGVGIAVGPPRGAGQQVQVHYVLNTVKGTRPQTVHASAASPTGTWTNGGATHHLQGAILARYSAVGAAGSVLGLPTTSELTTPDGVGRYTHFARGSIYWTPRTGAQTVRGAIRTTWSQLGWERSPVGYPTGEEFGLRNGGRVQRFTSGLVYWTPWLGAHEVRGAFGTHYAAQGWENGRLGYPRTGEKPVPGGVKQVFEGGTLTWQRSTGRVTRS